MKTQLIAAAVLAVIGTSAAWAAPAGGSSNTANVLAGTSDFPSIPIIAPDGYAALSMKRNDGNFSGFIPLRAPVTLTTTAATANTNGTYIAGIPLLMPNIAQVWRTDTSYNATAETFSLRQLSYPTAANWPHFGGLVIGRVAGTGNTDGVYFGEWSPARTGGALPAPSTDLNMGSSGRTVWYVGDNPTTSMPTLTSVTYNVVGIRGVGTSAGNQPYAPDLYTGALVANYSGGSGSITGSIVRGSDSVSFAGTSIKSTGEFGNGPGGNPGTIQGRFYNNANALAGIYTGGGASGNVAFGGKR
ncbi:MAG: hypothetical protein H3C26_03060 [Rhodocyclaceae bacterium]|nr:hypothetical protein [Rhodocyclaceae bacterium]